MNTSTISNISSLEDQITDIELQISIDKDTDELNALVCTLDMLEITNVTINKYGITPSLEMLLIQDIPYPFTVSQETLAALIYKVVKKIISVGIALITKLRLLFAKRIKSLKHSVTEITTLIKEKKGKVDWVASANVKYYLSNADLSIRNKFINIAAAILIATEKRTLPDTFIFNEGNFDINIDLIDRKIEKFKAPLIKSDTTASIGDLGLRDNMFNEVTVTLHNAKYIINKSDNSLVHIRNRIKNIKDKDEAKQLVFEARVFVKFLNWLISDTTGVLNKYINTFNKLKTIK